MFSFTLDGRFFFDRSEWNNSWHAYTPPSTPPTRNGYFTISDGRFIGNAGDCEPLTSAEIREIELYLADNIEQMDASQFAAHSQLPTHYHSINPSSNHYADILVRMRIHGEWDVSTSLALEEMATENPAYRLTREFVRELLARAHNIDTLAHDEWLREVAMDSWTYDCPEPRPTFEDYFEERKTAIYRPDYSKAFTSDSQQLYAIHGIPTLYYFHEEAIVADFRSPLINFRHFVDLDSVVAPVSLPYCGNACYIL
jgi:hypothetical protein